MPRFQNFPELIENEKEPLFLETGNLKCIFEKSNFAKVPFL